MKIIQESQANNDQYNSFNNVINCVKETRHEFIKVAEAMKPM